jgi:hypothetical protein
LSLFKSRRKTLERPFPFDELGETEFFMVLRFWGDMLNPEAESYARKLGEGEVMGQRCMKKSLTVLL